MKKMLSPIINDDNIMNYALHKALEKNIEINLSDETDTIIKSILLGVHNEEEEHLLLHPEFRSKIIESMIELPHVEAELKTEPDGHKLRGTETDVKEILNKALEKMRR